jgi:hypothetical protein
MLALKRSRATGNLEPYPHRCRPPENEARKGQREKREWTAPSPLPAWGKRLYDQTYRNAVKRGLLWRIRDFELAEMIRRADGRCEVSGIPFSFERHASAMRRPFAPSIDRIDSAVGYTPANTRLVSCIVNSAMGEWGEETFLKVVQAVSERRAGR